MLMRRWRGWGSGSRSGVVTAERTLNTQRPTSQRSTETTRAAAWLLADMLSDNAARALAFGMQSPLRFDFPVACKTGTSSDFRDNWAIGYTPEFTVGVWCGNFDGSPMHEVSGVTGAAPILHAVFEHLHARFGTTWFERPPEIVEREVHPTTGKLLARPRADGVREKFIAGRICRRWSRLSDYDATGRAILGPEYAEWSRSAENGLAARTAVEVGRRRNCACWRRCRGRHFSSIPICRRARRVPLRASAPGRGALEVRFAGGARERRTDLCDREGRAAPSRRARLRNGTGRRDVDRRHAALTRDYGASSAAASCGLGRPHAFHFASYSARGRSA